MKPIEMGRHMHGTKGKKTKVWLENLSKRVRIVQNINMEKGHKGSLASHPLNINV